MITTGKASRVEALERAYVPTIRHADNIHYSATGYSPVGSIMNNAYRSESEAFRELVLPAPHQPWRHSGHLTDIQTTFSTYHDSLYSNRVLNLMYGDAGVVIPPPLFAHKCELGEANNIRQQYLESPVGESSGSKMLIHERSMNATDEKLAARQRVMELEFNLSMENHARQYSSKATADRGISAFSRGETRGEGPWSSVPIGDRLNAQLQQDTPVALKARCAALQTRVKELEGQLKKS